MLLNRCGFLASAGGAADFGVAAAALGCRDPATAGAIGGAPYSYYAQSADLTQYEWGVGTWSPPSTFQRTLILGSSAGGAAVNFTQPPTVKLDALKENISTYPPRCGQLQYVSATLIEFVPYGGDLIKIAGLIYNTLGVVSAANTGVYVSGVAGQNLAASTFYYVYLFNNAGTLAVDFSTTGYVRDNQYGNLGVAVKNGDSSRSLIGWVLTNGSAQFQSSRVYSWFNPAVSIPFNSGTLSNNSITGTTSYKFFGYGGSFAFTPIRSGTLTIIGAFRSVGTATSAGAGDDYALYYGTGAAPANGQSTPWPGATQAFGISCSTPSGVLNMYPMSGMISGLTVGTTYWFDVAGLLGASSATMQLLGPVFSILEN